MCDSYADDEDTDDHAPIFLTYAKLGDNASKLNQQVTGLRAQASSNRYRQHDILATLYVVTPILCLPSHQKH